MLVITHKEIIKLIGHFTKYTICYYFCPFTLKFGFECRVNALCYLCYKHQRFFFHLVAQWQENVSKLILGFRVGFFNYSTIFDLRQIGFNQVSWCAPAFKVGFCNDSTIFDLYKLEMNQLSWCGGYNHAVLELRTWNIYQESTMDYSRMKYNIWIKLPTCGATVPYKFDGFSDISSGSQWEIVLIPQKTLKNRLIVQT